MTITTRSAARRKLTSVYAASKIYHANISTKDHKRHRGNKQVMASPTKQPIKKVTYNTTTRSKPKKRNYQEEYRPDKLRRIWKKVEETFPGVPHLLVYVEKGKLVIKTSPHWKPALLDEELPKCLISKDSLTDLPDKTPGKDTSRQPVILAQEEIDEMNSDERRSKLSEIVTNGMMKKAPRNIWGNQEELAKRRWWPDDVAFAPPKARMESKYIHTNETIGRCLYAYASSMFPRKKYGFPWKCGPSLSFVFTWCCVLCCIGEMKLNPEHGYAINNTKQDEEPYNASMTTKQIDLTSPETSDVPDPSEPQRLCIRNRIGIYQSDLDSLKDGGWLTSSIVDASIGKKMHAAGELAIAHESHWSQVRESKKKNIEKGLHIFPICMDSHWWLLVASVKRDMDVAMDNLFMLDSLGKGAGKRHEKAAVLLLKYLGMERGEKAKYNVVDVPQQKDADDCGVHTIHHAWRLREIGWQALHEVKKPGGITTTRAKIREYIVNG